MDSGKEKDETADILYWMQKRLKGKQRPTTNCHEETNKQTNRQTTANRTQGNAKKRARQQQHFWGEALPSNLSWSSATSIMNAALKLPKQFYSLTEQTWHEAPNMTVLSNVRLRISRIFPGPVPAQRKWHEKKNLHWCDGMLANPWWKDERNAQVEPRVQIGVNRTGNQNQSRAVNGSCFLKYLAWGQFPPGKHEIGYKIIEEVNTIDV